MLFVNEGSQIHLLRFIILVCRWENTESDILQCPLCTSAICIAFHPHLNKSSRDKLTLQYLEMLSTSHQENCVFRSYSTRWLKILKRLRMQKPEEDAKEGEITQQYVPPFLLSLSDQFLLFEDVSNNGSVTHYRIQQETHTLTKSLPKSTFEVTVPNEMSEYCEISTSKDCIPFLLATFGWHYITNTECVQCPICLSKAILPNRKRRLNEIKVSEIEEVKLHLIQSHRVYCPYVGGFSFGPGHVTESGWRVIVKNLVRYVKKKRGGDGVVSLDDLTR
jgi:hypothetical protein